VTASSIKALGGLLRAGLSVRSALRRWPSMVSASDAETASRLVRSLDLGLPAAAVLEAGEGPDLEVLARIVSTHQQCGGDLAAMIDTLGDDIAARNRRAGDAAAAVSGMRLSARMVAALPIVFFLLMPLSREGIAGRPGITLLLLGLGLAGAGFAWMSKLVPVPSQVADPVRTTAITLACAVSGGCSPQVVLAAISWRASGAHGAALTEARRRTALGSTWGRSLEHSEDPGLSKVGSVLRWSTDLGVPCAPALIALADSLAIDEQRRFEAEIRKAPVKMVLPLTVCVLPSFGLLGAGPMLRGLLL
jgi:tight adherence protein B